MGIVLAQEGQDARVVVGEQVAADVEAVGALQDSLGCTKASSSPVEDHEACTIPRGSRSRKVPLRPVVPEELEADSPWVGECA